MHAQLLGKLHPVVHSRQQRRSSRRRPASRRLSAKRGTSATMRQTAVASIPRKILGQGQSGQAIKLFQITPYVNDFQILNDPGSWQPEAPWKMNFTFHFWHKFFILDDVKLAEFWIKECEILGVKTYFDPLTYFQGLKTQAPQDLHPWLSGSLKLRSSTVSQTCNVYALVFQSAAISSATESLLSAFVHQQFGSVYCLSVFTNPSHIPH